ncbi:MAG TPA: 7-carboxy-7-deazaguanine synthase QueE [Gammaproteobacteria bacterium]|nr:7-carboxy-7-deazaguanine synthase QueE [Gammaproteobacteria bacterium]
MESSAQQAPAALAGRLRITEIFLSLQGESSTAGLPTVFVRLTGCPLRCHYCDTGYAFRGGEYLPHSAVLAQVAAYGVQHVTVTGGEPLAQAACLPLLSALCDAGYRVSLETCGALDVSQVDARVMKVIDLKTPGSGEMEKNLYSNLDYLAASDQVKFVICDRADYEWARDMLAEHRLAGRCELLFSPSAGQQDATRLAEWILEDRLPVRFQLQLHKILWGDEAGH